MSTLKAIRTTAAILFFLGVFAAGPALAGETPEATPTPADACGLEIELPGLTAQGGMSPAVQPEPEFLAKPIRRGFCHCGCGGGCTTDADCGPGGRCVAFITCC